MAGVGYFTVGSDDLEKAKAFYDALLTPAGFKALVEHPSGGRVYIGDGKTLFGVLGPHDGQPARAGNGVMGGFACASPEDVAAFHARALELGATDEGAPGERVPGAHFGYFRDADGHKLCAYHLG